MIQCIALRKQYGELVAVDDLDLEIAPGEVFGFLGPNGAGKTTTIRMMIGLLEPTAGQVLLGGHDLAREPEAAKALARLRARSAVPLRQAHRPRSSCASSAGSTASSATRSPIAAPTCSRSSACSTAREELVETYSHGMKQRLALAAALIHRPRILILDEPMVGLDPQGALALRQLLGGLAASGVTIFLSTHSLARRRGALRSHRHPRPRPPDRAGHARRAAHARERVPRALAARRELARVGLPVAHRHRGSRARERERDARRSRHRLRRPARDPARAARARDAERAPPPPAPRLDPRAADGGVLGRRASCSSRRRCASSRRSARSARC